MALVLKTSLLLITAVNCMNMEESFFNHLVKDRRNHSYFLVINVDAPNYKGKMIIENGSLLLFLNKTQGLPEVKYESFATDLLVNKSWLKTEEVKLERWGFKKLIRIKAVDDVASKGQEEFIKHYFAGRVIKRGISDDEKIAIIEKLFEWLIATQIDDETGYLVYTIIKEGRQR